METNDRVEAKLIKHLVDRFLGWHLPKDFHPDGGIMFTGVYNNGTEQGGKFEPIGTNLFTAEQAKEMFRFLLEHEDGTSFLTTHEREAISEYKQFVLNILDGIDIADGQCNTKAIRHALATKI